jgi:hypothetical protein
VRQKHANGASILRRNAEFKQDEKSNKGMVMRKSVIWVILLLSVYFQGTAVADCDSYTGTHIDATKEVALPIGKALTAINTHNAKGLFTNSAKTLLLLRRSVSGGEEGRTGNIRLPLRPRDVDSNLNIHIGDQVFAEFGEHGLFDGMNAASAISVSREVCEGARHCDDALPGSEEVPFMMKNLLQCNRSGKGVFVFSDGMFVTDMQLAAGKLPVGSALFFTKEAGAYRLAGLIIQR